MKKLQYFEYEGLTLASAGGRLPQGSRPAERGEGPVCWLVERDPMTSRGFFPVRDARDLTGPEDWTRLDASRLAPPEPLAPGFAVNTAFPDVLARQRRFQQCLDRPKKRLTLVGLGDVGGQLLTALKLLGTELEEIGVYDPNEALCRRYALELDQILDRPLPRIVIRPAEELFDCEFFLFTASRGVPPLGSRGDVRMLQLEQNREMLKTYSRQAREAGFSGLFCQISDPVDQLARCVFLQSNRDENGRFDFRGLLPEQIAGFGLGVMMARAAHMARRLGADCPNLRVYGPHGADLGVANDPEGYNPVLSQELTRRTVGANLEVRELGFKPYIAPAISSAALSILALLRGEPFLGAVPMGGVYFGCRGRLTGWGQELVAEPLHPELAARIEAAWSRLKEAEPQCLV